MTRTLLALGAFVFAASAATAQDPSTFDYVSEVRGDTLVVANFFDAGNVAGTLASVIQQDTDAYGAANVPAGRVYMLTAGSNGTIESGNLSLYLFNGGITEQGRQLTIVGEFCGLMVQGDDPNCRPPSIAGFQNAAGDPTLANFAINDDLTLKNLHFTSAHTQGESDWSFVNINGNNLDIRWENVLGEHNRWTFSNSNDNPGTNLYITDSYFVNATDQNSRRNGGIYDAVGVPTDVVWVENTTHVQNAGMQYKFRSFSPSQVMFNHNTFVNAAGQLFLGFGYLTNFAATNNLFVNSNYQPYYPGLDRAENYPATATTADFQPHGIINLAPLPTDASGSYANTTASYPGTEPFAEADRQVLVDLNAAYWDPLLLTIASDLNTAGVEGDVCDGDDGCVTGDASLNWSDQAILANQRTTDIFNDNTTYPLITWGTWYDGGAPGFVDGPGMVQELYNWGYDSANTGITNAELLPKIRTAGNEAGKELAESGGNNWITFDWPVAVDLAYSNATYLSGGLSGYPLGDLNWFAAEKSSWMSQRDAEYAAIESALSNGTALPTAEEGVPSLIGRLEQNRPNPFSGVTTIAFELASASDVSLDVFDALGRRVATLFNGTLAAGPHSVEWDGGSLSSGVYVYTLRAGSTVESRRMVITR